VPEEGTTIWLEQTFQIAAHSVPFKQGAGCPHCNHSGFKGRVGVYELLELRHETLEALRMNDSSRFIAAARATPGFRRFSDQALDLVRQGITTIDEVQRISGI
jgi:MSHA biogenesis protein MshE